MTSTAALQNLVWPIAELLRGDFRQSEYGKVVLPLVLIRRLDCLLEATKPNVLQVNESIPENADPEMRDLTLSAAAGDGLTVYNVSKFTLAQIANQEAGDVKENLTNYIFGFSPNVRDILIEKFAIMDWIAKLATAKLLWKVFEKVVGVDLHPNVVSNEDMGNLFESLIRDFSELSNETAGEHFTPREVVNLIVDLLLARETGSGVTQKGKIRRVYDCAVGTGGMLAAAEEHLKRFNPDIRVELYGQELNPESYAICKSDMLMKGYDADSIAFGNTLTQDAFADQTFHYMVSNPPYGVDWNKYAEEIEEEHKELGWNGRFGAGLPRKSDGQFLFVQHLLSKMRDDEEGSRIGIVMNGSPLFTGGAGSAESEIRRWIIENDWLEAIVALPTDIFYNTGIQTYIWLLTNRKSEQRKGKIQLIDASGERFWAPMRKSLGNKRREITESARNEIVRIYAEFLNGDSDYADVSKIFDSSEFGYREIRVERPLRLKFQVTEEGLGKLKDDKAFAKLSQAEQDEVIDVLNSRLPNSKIADRAEFEKLLDKAFKGAGIKVQTPVRKAILAALSERDPDAAICMGKGDAPEPDAELRDHELVPLHEDWREYVAREVTPFVGDAWVDDGYVDGKDGLVGRVGYEINFNRYFHKPTKSRPLQDIQRDMERVESEIAGLILEFVS